jgi:hypothetical protein
VTTATCSANDAIKNKQGNFRAMSKKTEAARDPATFGRVTVLVAGGLTAVGLLGYFLTGRVSPTALIPAALGVPLFLLGNVVVNGSDKSKKIAAHIAVLIGAAGLFGTFKGVGATVEYIQGGEVDKPAAAAAKAVTFLLSAGYTVFSINWFVQGRIEKAKREK